MSHQLLSKRIGEVGVGYGIYYPLPAHRQKPFKQYSKEKYPEAEKAAEQLISLPIHPGLSARELETIVEVIYDKN